MDQSKKIEWVLRIAVAGEFIGHGVLALEGKKTWIEWINLMTGADFITAGTLLVFIGLMDIAVACIILFHPVRIALLWAAFWGFWTALVRPLVGESFWDFIERFANWGAPLALLIQLGWPKTVKEWFK